VSSSRTRDGCAPTWRSCVRLLADGGVCVGMAAFSDAEVERVRAEGGARERCSMVLLAWWDGTLACSLVSLVRVSNPHTGLTAPSS
jgi:hypothetical protein